MVTAEMYKNYLSSYGSNLAQVKKNQSDAIMNNSFTADAQYKRVYILTKDGWKWKMLNINVMPSFPFLKMQWIIIYNFGLKYIIQ